MSKPQWFDLVLWLPVSFFIFTPLARRNIHAFYAFFLTKIHFLILISLHCQGMCKLGMAIFPSSGLVPPPVNVCQNRNDSIRSCDYLCHFSFLHRWPSILFAWANPELTVYDLFKLGHSYKLAWFSSFPDFFPLRKYVIYLTANWVITLQKQNWMSCLLPKQRQAVR